MNEQEKLALLEETFEVDEGTLTPEMSLDDVDEYDSLAKLSLVVMMEDNFDKKITAEIIRGFKTVADILAFMTKEE